MESYIKTGEICGGQAFGESDSQRQETAIATGDTICAVVGRDVFSKAKEKVQLRKDRYLVSIL